MRAYGWTGLLATSTLIISTSAFGGDKGGKVADLVKDAKVTAEQAIKTAGENVPGTVVEAELEKKHGKTVWEVEVFGADGSVTEVHIDAARPASWNGKPYHFDTRPRAGSSRASYGCRRTAVTPTRRSPRSRR